MHIFVLIINTGPEMLLLINHKHDSYILTCRKTNMGFMTIFLCKQNNNFSFIKIQMEYSILTLIFIQASRDT